MKESQAIANLTIPVSTKHTINIGKWVKGKNVDDVIKMLNQVISKERAVPFVKFNNNVPHKKGMTAGRYPVKAAKHVIKGLELVKNNAEVKDLDVSNLIINEFIPNRARSVRQRAKYRSGRSTHLKIGVVVGE